MQYSLIELESKITELPMLPAVIFELSKANPDDINFFDKLYELAHSDPALASMIISSANAASSSPNVHIHSLKAALTRVGSQTIYRLVALASVSKVFIPSRKHHKELWQHSVEVGILSAEIYKQLFGDGESVQVAYLCGLLHDIGRLVMFQFSPDVIDSIAQADWETPDDLIDVESDKLGYDHCSLGYMVTKKMDLPSLITNVIRYHHSVRALKHPKVPKTIKRILISLQVADAISVYVSRHDDCFNWCHEQLEADMIKSIIKPEWEIVLPIMPHICSILSSEIEKAEEQSRALGL
ncbi:HDOD domain-containing protein [Neptuniibacter sp.]|uniref:HDOD domain-containing protein n=1 Tax=Neptuniibacter sp. TaxID=1962643 RepID=UPI002630E6C2|nr:HDOD domain-containing protein [Neptuniibacter sp.]MCP4597126.1 HDOD domain-containing protein [Neptuniibacter sp.]